MSMSFKGNTPACCSVLQYVQCVAACCREEEERDEHVIQWKYFRLLQCVAVCWSVLQCVATRIRALNMLFKGNTSACCSVLLYVAVYYSVLQWGGGGGRWTCDLKKILPHVAVCCSMLQCADVCSNQEEEGDTKEPYYHLKEPNQNPKEHCKHSTEPHLASKELYVNAIQTQRSSYVHTIHTYTSLWYVHLFIHREEYYVYIVCTEVELYVYSAFT